MLTPHLIHPNFWALGRTREVYKVEYNLPPVSEDERKERAAWCARQVQILKFNPSNAVLK